VSTAVGGEKLLMVAMLAAVTAQPSARAEEAAQHLVAAVRAAVAAPPSAGADMFAMVGWGEPLLGPWQCSRCHPATSCSFPFVLVPPFCLVAVSGILSGAFYIFRSLVKLWNPNYLVERWCGRGRERLVPLTYSTPLIDR